MIEVKGIARFSFNQATPSHLARSFCARQGAMPVCSAIRSDTTSWSAQNMIGAE